MTTAMAFRIQDAYNALVQQIHDDDALLEDPDFEETEEQRMRREEVRIELEITVGELLRLGINLDYADEIGRRKMFQLVQGMLSQDVLPEPILMRALDVLRVLTPDEKDLIRVVVEVVHELRDPQDEDADKADVSADLDESMTEFGSPRRPQRAPQLPKPIAEMTPEEKARADAVDLRCLALCIGMLERVNGASVFNVILVHRGSLTRSTDIRGKQHTRRYPRRIDRSLCQASGDGSSREGSRLLGPLLSDRRGTYHRLGQ